MLPWCVEQALPLQNGHQYHAIDMMLLAAAERHVGNSLQRGVRRRHRLRDQRGGGNSSGVHRQRQGCQIGRQRQGWRWQEGGEGGGKGGSGSAGGAVDERRSGNAGSRALRRASAADGGGAMSSSAMSSGATRVGGVARKGAARTCSHVWSTRGWHGPNGSTSGGATSGGDERRRAVVSAAVASSRRL